MNSSPEQSQLKATKSPNLTLCVLCLGISSVSLFILGRWFVNLNNLLHSKLQLALCMGCDAMLGAQCTRLISHRIHTVPINAAGEDYLQSVRTLLGVNVKCAQFPFPLIIPAMCMSAPRTSPACVCVSSGHWWGVRDQSEETISLHWSRSVPTVTFHLSVLTERLFLSPSVLPPSL